MGLGDEGFLAGSMDEASVAINLNFKACLPVCLAVARCLYVTFTGRYCIETAGSIELALWHGTYRTLCYKEIRVSPKITKVCPTARRSSHCFVNLV